MITQKEAIALRGHTVTIRGRAGTYACVELAGTSKTAVQIYKESVEQPIVVNLRDIDHIKKVEEL